ncbi:MAG: DUF1127 domain-containing protein [Thiolinea sp.]
MNELKETGVLDNELEEPKPSKLPKLITELVVQSYQTAIDICTAYRRTLWLKQRQHTRQQLLDLSDDQLKDIGVSREAANREANKCFWE